LLTGDRNWTAANLYRSDSAQWNRIAVRIERSRMCLFARLDRRSMRAHRTGPNNGGRRPG
jgi:hypothetical protein